MGNAIVIRWHSVCKGGKHFLDFVYIGILQWHKPKVFTVNYGIFYKPEDIQGILGTKKLFLYKIDFQGALYIRIKGINQQIKSN